MRPGSGEVVSCEPARTPIGRYGGMFTSLTARAAIFVRADS